MVMTEEGPEMADPTNDANEIQQRGRLPWYRPRDLNDAQRAVYDDIVGGPRAGGAQLSSIFDDEGRLEGPFNAMLVNPAIGGPLQALGAGIRYSTDLTPRQRESAILTVASHHESEFELRAHEAIGRSAGLTEAELSALLHHRTPETYDATEIAIVQVVKQLIERRDLNDDEFMAASQLLGVSRVVEIVTLVGYYQLLAMSLRVFRVPLPDDGSP